MLDSWDRWTQVTWGYLQLTWDNQLTLITAFVTKHKQLLSWPKTKRGNSIVNLEVCTVTFLSGSKYQLRDSPSVCRALNAWLPEVRDIKDLQEFQDFLNGTGVWRVLARIHYSKPTNKFQFDSDSMNVRATELFPFAQYGGSYTGSYHQAD
jgi:hypothetical protein